MYSTYPAASPASGILQHIPESDTQTPHAATYQYTNVEGGGEDDGEQIIFTWDELPAEEDDQTTPRASQAGASKRYLSRDDTAADVSMSMFDLPGFASEASTARRYTQFSDPHSQFRAWSANNSFTQDFQPSQYQVHKPSLSQLTQGLDTSDYLAPSIPQPTQPMIPQSLYAGAVPHVSAAGPVDDKRVFRKRWSKNCPQKINALYEQVKSQASLRTRRASTPLNGEPHAHTAGRHMDIGLMAAPLSPSKRNARHAGDLRARKFRSTMGYSANDRKDTPAPIPTSSLVARPAAPRPADVVGGDCARKAAAAARSALTNSQDPDLTRWGLHQSQNRQRVGSLSSAADSGADLGTFEDTCNDSVADDMDMGPQEQVEVRLDKHDFVEHLPPELTLQIFSYLDADALEAASHVKPSWKEMAEDSEVWHTVFLRKYDRQVYSDPAPIAVGGLGIGKLNKKNQEWKKMYMARVEVEKNWRKGAQDAGKAIYLSGHTDSVYCLQFDEQKIITGSRDRTIRVWDINTLQCLRVIGGPNVRPVAGPKVLRTVDYPSFHLATASSNGTAHGDQIYKVPSQWHDASILCLQYDDEILVTGSSDSDLIVWDIHTYEPLHRLCKHQGGVLDVALDSKHIISCSKDSRIIVWDRKTFEPKGDLTGHRGPVNAVQLRGKFLVSASGDGIARLWDLEQMKLIQEFSAKERGLAAVEFSEDMKYVLAGGNDHVTYKFEVATGNEVKQFTGHSQLVRSLWLDSANSRVVSGSYDLDLRVYDFVSGAELWRGEEWTTSWMLAAKSDYRRIVATSQDGRILIVDFGLKKGGLNDGQQIEDVELLRGVDNPHAIVFRNPWCKDPKASRLPSVLA